ncbi:DUF799 domain-containing protein [Rheinheimera sp. EpRS3]|uniref:DUF799 domain-containing protein n=1 Tax=Rheinheimera sp. EpRS3 TaxID=1712383 RepID=UPI0007475CBC|nr:DUF799 domain-containing protein [Rheinheimera sp. EpRS3]KUM51980.1 hypothetical protein AR688_01300 [Rheinheimera sp. EpRS3]
MHWLKLYLVGAVVVLAGCVSAPPAHDYSAFRSADPHSILVLPPINNSVEVVAPYSLMSQISQPIAESGYYVFPVALVEQTFRSNGLTEATDIHAVPFSKVHEIFGADTGLYITIDKYGTNYVVLSSETIVTISATLVDLRSGVVLWQDSKSASSAESRGSSGGGLVGMLVEAAMNQILETITDRGFDIAAISTNRLLFAESHNGLLYGPRSPKYGQPVASEKKK